MKKIIIACTLFAALISFGLFYTNQSDKPENIPFKQKEEVEKSGAWESMQFINTSRAYPERDIPTAAYTRAFQYYKSHFLNNSTERTSSASTWYSLGPENVGGRTLSMAFDPNNSNTIWLGSASGGLWKSITGGTGINAWTYVPTGYPVLGISSVAIDPLDPNNMFIGTGEMYSHGSAVNGLIERPTRGTVGMGILKSTDGGNTWAPSLDWQYQQTRGVWDLQINPLNPQVVYAATTEGVYKSNDGGATWSVILNELMVMDILLDPVDTNYIYAGVGNVDSPNPGIYKSSNAGLNWQRVAAGLPPSTNTGRITLSMNKQNHNSLIALVADLYSTVGIYTSKNNGSSWTLSNGLTEIVSYQGWYAKGLCMKDDDSTQVLFGGVYLFESSQQGAFPNLSPSAYDIHPDIHDIISDPHDPNKLYILTDGGLFKSDDFGTFFYDCNDGYVTSQSYIGSVSSQDENLIFSGLQDNNTIRYDGSPYWTPVLGGDGSFNVIDPLNDQTVYASWQYLNVTKSTDRGWTFYDILNHSANSASTNNGVAFIAPFALSYSNTSILYAASDSLYRSDDRGSNWFYPLNDALDSGNVALCMAISRTEQDSLYIATGPSANRGMKVQRSGDGGASFTNISAGLPDRFPRDIAVDPRDSKVVYIAFSGFGAGHLFKSTNAGSTWNDISTTLPDIPFHCITLDELHPDTLFAGCDFGVFVSVDAGLTWDAMNLGFPDAVMVFDIAYSSNDQSILAFTHGNGVFRNDGLALPVGIKNPGVTYKADLQILNNPVRNELKYRTNLEGQFLVKVVDMQGKIILSKQSENHRTHFETIDASMLKSGLYFLIAEQNGRNSIKKFVKN